MSSVLQGENHHPGQNGFPLRLFATAFLVSLLVAVTGAGLLWVLQSSLNDLQARQFQLAEYSSQVMLFDEALTMSARMAAATGDPAYMQRYDEFDANLSALLMQTESLLSQPEILPFIVQTGEANRKLVDIERRALALSAEGRLTEATDLLVSDEYMQWKGVYADGVERAVAKQRGAIQGTNRQLQLATFGLMGSIGVVVLILFGTCYFALRAGVRWNRERLRSDAALRNARDELEVRVRDRTADLQIANETLRDNTKALTREIEERERVQEKLQFAHTLLTTAFETSPDAILVVDEHARIISFNRRFGAMWGIPEDVISAGDDAPVLAAVTASMKNPSAFLARVQDLYAHPEEVGHDELETIDGRFIDRQTAALRTAAGQHLGRVWFFRDVSDSRHAEAEVRHTARHDALTGLANRREFMEAVQQAVARAERGDRRFAVLYLDLDRFKDVNDTLGHPVGDQLLCAVAERLQHNSRKTDLVARFGGDEFAVIAAAIDDATDAANLADKLVAALGTPFSIRGNDIRISVSIGIAVCESGGDDPEMLLSHADMALYRAKADGRAGYRFFTDAMDTEVRTRVTLSAELRNAIASGQLFLEYQPQVAVETGRIVGVEALVRWRHPVRGVLLPGEFVRVAEKTGLIVALDRWVKREACRQGKAWLDAGVPPMAISVNVSGAQFKRAIELENDVAHVLATSGLPAHLLELELTETVLMEASREHNDVLVRLRQKGIRLAIDDFGTGYSSLDYLRRFPVDRLKVAQELIKDIAADPGSAAIVRATIALARELGMTVIAEGVETSEQLELLKAWGCLQAQGYYFSRPLAPGDLALLLRGSGTVEPTSVGVHAAA